MDASNLKEKADNFNPEHKEGPVARTIEEYTAKLPSDLFLWAALGSMAVSATLKIMKKDDEALFVGQWPAPFLLLGLYNKIVKVEGHEGEKRGDKRPGGAGGGNS
ncbi:hypothetical protein ACD591_08625 [Rufibacter glacialis]|uniref:Uncharacterized protein n=1 Tax=Rufibacter glacialis TaxID=1259555 RepID=A0A5M8QCF5_9BACT|nr:hypothetical protein [Rufibacter glacialis]KAA6432496.1 hypothetical protein FOE74_15480 [Rufibacter glacialis]GGK79175.1 hypothetical protein GCM10011405_28790 [Rufibacter glacialis]